MALHWYIKKKATDFKGFYIFLIAKRAEKDHFSQKSDEDGLMALRTIPIRRAGNRTQLFMGGDRELVMFSGLIAFALVFSAQELRASIYGLLLWLCSLYLLRLMAKADPQLRFVYLRHRRYQRYYPAQSTPFRSNPRSQGKQYR